MGYQSKFDSVPKDMLDRRCPVVSLCKGPAASILSRRLGRAPMPLYSQNLASAARSVLSARRPNSAETPGTEHLFALKSYCHTRLHYIRAKHDANMLTKRQRKYDIGRTRQRSQHCPIRWPGCGGRPRSSVKTPPALVAQIPALQMQGRTTRKENVLFLSSRIPKAISQLDR